MLATAPPVSCVQSCLMSLSITYEFHLSRERYGISHNILHPEVRQLRLSVVKIFMTNGWFQMGMWEEGSLGWV
jgi:hypothetical protein